MSSPAPLDGIRVLDFCWVGAGSYTTRMLADHGADVIKVESISRPDQTRLTPPFADRIAGVNRSGYFADRNTSKRSLALNIKTDEGLELARELVRHSDAITNNFRPGVMERIGLGYDAVTEIREDIIFLEMSMQGGTGPDKDYFGYGLTIGALSGLHDLCGDPDREPIGTGTNFPDHVPSPGHAVVALLAALRHRARTGQGQYIDVAQIEATVSSLGVPTMQALATDTVPTRTSNLSDTELLDLVLPCQGDRRWIAVSIRDGADWPRLTAVLGEAVDAARDAVASGAPDAEDVARAALSAVTVARDPWELMESLQARGVAAGVVQNAGDVVSRDPQLAHREHFVRLPHEEMGETIYNVAPFRFGRTPCRIRRPAPCLGEHTFDVLQDVLGMSSQECEELAARGILS